VGGTLRRNPSALLLGAQLAAVLAYPFLDSSALGRAGVGVAGLVVVAAALWAVRRTPALTWVALLVGVPAMVFTVLEAIYPSHDSIVLVSALLHAPLYLYISYGMIRYVFADEHVTSDEIYAVGAAFTVVAWGFAYVYAAAQVVWPGSFSGTGGGDRSWFELLFLSFTTLTSTGLSDITPVLAHARSLSMVEQVTGVFYIAFVVARMVALTVVRRRPEQR
jgi:Ion channel